MQLTNLVTLAGGLGLFLFGIKVMSEGLEHAAGSRLKKLLEVLTTNRLMAVFVGFLITALIQSSSATTVMVVGFVNANLMSLSQAVGVIMGANIGTTITSLLIAINFSGIAPLAVFIGVVLAVFAKKTMPKNVGHIIIGFGMLFVGMTMMSEAMKPLRDFEPFKDFLTHASNPFLGVLLGILMTVLLQSSSASIGILQALAFQNLVGIDFAIFVLFGQNIGTCVTALISTAGTKRNSKRAAIIHLLFNVIGTVLFFCIALFTPYTTMLKSFTDNTVAQIAAAHIIFNVVSTIVMLPFGNVLVILAQKIIPGKDGLLDDLRFEYLDDRLLATPPFAVAQVGKEVERMGTLARNNFSNGARALINRDESGIKEIFRVEEIVNFLNHNITAYLVKLNAVELQTEDSKYIGTLFHVINDIERIGDHALNLAEAAQKNLRDNLTISAVAKDELENLFNNVLTLLDRSLHAFNHQHLSEQEGKELGDLEEHIDDLTVECQDAHIFRLNRNECSTESGMLFMNTINDFERVADHAINIAFLTREAN